MLYLLSFFFFFFNDTATTEIYTLSYTTLFRSTPRIPLLLQEGTLPARSVSPFRSEEHTSELQSHDNLVCRLLLEKKKKQKRKHTLLQRPANDCEYKQCRTVH